MSTSVRCCFSSCHTIASLADMDLVRLVSFQLRLSVTGAAGKLQAFSLFIFFFLFFCLDVKEKKVQYLNPFGLSHVQDSICMSRSHVIIPSFFFSLFSLCSLPPSRSTAPGRLFPLAPTAHCATYTTQSRVEVI